MDEEETIYECEKLEEELKRFVEKYRPKNKAPFKQAQYELESIRYEAERRRDDV